MNTWRILHGDVRERLRDLPDGSVQTCVTSPPYWGLRDYGTGQWSGGDSSCDHLTEATGIRNQGRNRGASGGKFHDSPVVNEIRTHFRSICGKCGARRIDNQIGLEQTPEQFVNALVEVFREVRRVLKDDATCWINLGDSFADKQLQGVPWRVAFALQNDGWFLRSDVIWSKPNPMPESVTDRPTKAHEYIFLLSKAARYYYDAGAIVESAVQSSGGWQNRARAGLRTVSATTTTNGDRNDGGECVGVGRVGDTRNKRSVWHIATQPYPESHFATMPEDLVKPCILAATSEKGQCPACGEAWVRVVEVGESSWQRRKADGDPIRYGHMGNAAQLGRSLSDADDRAAGGFGVPASKQTVGWQPSCDCNAGAPVPQTVLDPFNGSGTTGAVAIRHQRNYIGIELNADYITLARKRIGAVAPLFSEEVA